MAFLLHLRRRLGVAVTGLVLSGTVVGCKHCDSGCGGHGSWLDRNHFDKCATITPGSLPQPNGRYVREFQNMQAFKAEEDDFVIYLNEWFMGGTKLGPYGEYHLGQIAHRLPEVPFRVMLQASPDGELNAVRRTHIVELLIRAGITDADVRVTVGFPAAERLDGNESERIYNQYLQNYGDQNGGNRSSSFGNGGIGLGGFGLGGLGSGGFGRGSLGLGRPFGY